MKIILFLFIPAAASAQLSNSGFEDTPFTQGWDATNVTTEIGLNGSTTAARLSYNSSATLGQSFAATANGAKATIKPHPDHKDLSILTLEHENNTTSPFSVQF